MLPLTMIVMLSYTFPLVILFLGVIKWKYYFIIIKFSKGEVLGNIAFHFTSLMIRVGVNFERHDKNTLIIFYIIS